MPGLRQQGRGAGFLGRWHGVPFAGRRHASDVRPWLGRGVLLMTNEVNTVTVQVFVVSSPSCRPDTTWEAAVAFLRQRLHERFGTPVAVMPLLDREIRGLQVVQQAAEFLFTGNGCEAVLADTASVGCLRP